MIIVAIALLATGATMAFMVLMYNWVSLMLYSPSATAGVGGLIFLAGLIVYLVVKD